MKIFEQDDTFAFDDIKTEEIGGDRYYVTPYGKFKSVTSILKVLADEKALFHWRKRVGDKEADRQTQEAVDRGNVLHDLSEKYLLNKLNESDVGNDEGSSMFLSSRKYLDTIEKVVAVEVPLYSKKYQYAGRVDGIVYHDGELCIIDHKNSKKLLTTNLKYIREKLLIYQLQIYFYAVAFEEMTGQKVDKGILFVAKPKTKPDDNVQSEMIKFEFTKQHKQLFDALVERW